MRFIKYFIYYNISLIIHISICSISLWSLLQLDYPTSDLLSFVLGCIGISLPIISFFAKFSKMTDLRIKDIKIRRFMDKVKFVENKFVYKGLVIHNIEEKNYVSNTYLYSKYKNKKEKLKSLKSKIGNGDKIGNINNDNLTNEQKAKRIVEAYPNAGYYRSE